jgi:glycosyltransferase involved in cell wall biosynthesis
MVPAVSTFQENAMNVLVLTRYSRMGASSRLRMLQYIETGFFGDTCFEFSPLLDDDYLRTIYAKRQVAPWRLLHAYAKRLAILLSAHKFDVLWIEKELFPNLPAFFECLLARLGIAYMVDYDDAIFHTYDKSHNPVKRLLRNKIAAVMRHATLVVPGNLYLASYARQAGARWVEIMPTVVDASRYAPVHGNDGSRIVIGWIGTPTTAKFLEPILPVLVRLAAQFPIELAVIGATLDSARYPFVQCRAWSEAAEAAEIGRFDIGIMPLLDDHWERGKCGYKLIQYMACGKAVIASPVGMNTEIVNEGVNGLLAATDDAWFSALSLLAGNRQMRQAMGERGRAIVEQKYCLQVTAPQLAGMMRGIARESVARAKACRRMTGC